MMAVRYRKTIQVQANDLDALNHVNNVRYLEWVQDISKEHWEHQVPEEARFSMIWVVRNHNITYFESAQLNDEVLLETEVSQWKGPISLREVTMKNNKTGDLLVKASTQWCALDPQTFRPIRVPRELQELFMDH